MVLAPERATMTLTAGGTSVLGLRDVSITDKTTLVEVTADADTAVKRFPTIDDTDFKVTLIYDGADAGQAKILQAKATHTPYSYVHVKGSVTFTLTAYVESVAWSKGPKDEQVVDVNFAVSGGCAVTGL
jgi:hypothetical protein